MLAGRFRLPFINKDGFKEPLGEVLGAGDREWSRKLGIASYEMLYAVCERLLEAGVSHIIESNFRPDFATERFRAMKAKYGYEPFEIHCTARDDVILDRYTARGASGERHPVHLDSLRLEDLEEALRTNAHPPLDMGGTLFTIDTTDFASVDYEPVFSALDKALGKG
jgi:predicted kinase